MDFSLKSCIIVQKNAWSVIVLCWKYGCQVLIVGFILKVFTWF